MIRVRLQYRPDCPRCDKLIEELMLAGIKYGFEVFPELVDTELEPFYLKDLATQIYNEEWIKKYGSKKQKELYKKAGHIFEFLGSQTATPIVQIEWHVDGVERAVVIKGFSEKSKDIGIRNIVFAVVSILRNLQRRLMHEG